MTTSTQWRLFFPAGDCGINDMATDGGNLEIVEVEMRGSVGGADQCSGGAASASASISGFAASNAFDNSTSTMWGVAAANSVGSWLQYTFASAVTVEEVMVRTNIQSTAPSVIWVQYWDGTDWQTYFTCNDDATPLNLATATSYVYSRSGAYSPNDGYTKWRLLFTTGAAGSALEIANIEMFDKDSSGDRSFAGTPSASSQFSAGFAPANLFRVSGAWAPISTNIKGTGEWAQFEFFRPEMINSVRITPNSANKGPQGVSVQYYDPATSSWVTDWTFTATWPVAGAQTFTK